MADIASLLKSAPLLLTLLVPYLALRRSKSGLGKAKSGYPALAARLGLEHRAPQDATRIGALRGTYRGRDVFVDPDERPRIVLYFTSGPAVVLRNFELEKRTPPGTQRLLTGRPAVDGFLKDAYASAELGAALTAESSRFEDALGGVRAAARERLVQLSMTSERLECVLDFGRPVHFPPEAVERLLPPLVALGDFVEGLRASMPEHPPDPEAPG